MIYGSANFPSIGSAAFGSLLFSLLKTRCKVSLAQKSLNMVAGDLAKIDTYLVYM
jgi:hypothetical protein